MDKKITDDFLKVFKKHNIKAGVVCLLDNDDKVMYCTSGCKSDKQSILLLNRHIIENTQTVTNEIQTEALSGTHIGKDFNEYDIPKKKSDRMKLIKELIDCSLFVYHGDNGHVSLESNFGDIIIQKSNLKVESNCSKLNNWITNLSSNNFTLNIIQLLIGKEITYQGNKMFLI